MLCDKKHSHVQWRDFKMNVLVCDDDQQIVDSIIEELKKKSEETHDLSNLPFDASDIVVLLSNLLDNAIEACQQYDKGDKAIHVMAVAQQDFFVSVRNTSEPVVIINGSIPTTKPEPQMHGFGLANIRLILEKYSGEYTMFYENGWFQFTADIPLTPIS